MNTKLGLFPSPPLSNYSLSMGGYPLTLYGPASSAQEWSQLPNCLLWLHSAKQCLCWQNTFFYRYDIFCSVFGVKEKQLHPSFSSHHVFFWSNSPSIVVFVWIRKRKKRRHQKREKTLPFLLVPPTRTYAYIHHFFIDWTSREQWMTRLASLLERTSEKRKSIKARSSINSSFFT